MTTKIYKGSEGDITSINALQVCVDGKYDFGYNERAMTYKKTVEHTKKSTFRVDIDENEVKESRSK